MRGEGLIQGLLDLRCSRHFAWRQLIECGETYQRLAAQPGSAGRLAQLPAVPASWANLSDLAHAILDPVVSQFGPIELTYCFAPLALTHFINGRIAPKLDQHAAAEVDSRGEPVCSRGGAAVDFLVPEVPMDAVMGWIAGELDFDRMYFYGQGRPIHVSWHPQPSRSIVQMQAGPSGRLIPRPLRPKGGGVR